MFLGQPLSAIIPSSMITFIRNRYSKPVCDRSCCICLTGGATLQATRITANEVLVVYRRTPDAPLGAEVHRQVIHGPGVHVPTADEWLHEFVWHGSDSHNKARMVRKTTWPRHAQA